MANVEQELPPAASQEPKPSVPSKRILVVEDKQDVAETMAQLLRYAGHEVALAHDGPSALSKTEAFEPQVVLLDIGLPGMDGYEVARRLRQNPRMQNAVLAALTGQAEDIERASAAGSDKHFIKPGNIGALDDFLDKVDSNGRD